MKTIIKSFIIAISIYSKIPVPKMNLNKSDMKYHLCFFPFVGILIGALEYLWLTYSNIFSISKVLQNLFAISIPILVSGGFHIDGFIDTIDAIHSYQPKEKKMEILKDPHVGAFSIIYLILFFILAIAFSFEINTPKAKISICFSFVISRTLSALSVIVFPKAKKDGMLANQSKTESPKIVITILLIELITSFIFLIFFTQNSLYGIISICTFAISFIYYFIMSKKNFGGITGDIAGFFICISEIFSLIGIAIYSIMVA